MPITVIVRSAGSDSRLTFDGMQPVVIGRGASCDVRLPDASVSHRHACLRVQGTDFILVDEGSTNGTFVGQTRIAPHTSRLVRSGDAVRVGRLWLELRVDQSPVTRDVAASTRELALALVSQAMAARGSDVTAMLRVVEGPDQGACLALDEGRRYLIGRSAQCDLPLGDGDSSREHARVERRGNVVVARDLGAKNGTWLGETRAPENRDVAWRPAQMMRIGRTVLALEEPVSDALAQIESAPDEALPVGEPVDPSAHSVSGSGSRPAPSHPGATEAERGPAPMAPVPAQGATPSTRRRRTGLSIADLLVMATAIGILALSVAGLVWLLH
jgi:pSer/pThr/pTyr-binding forkhead associated (FHA) protein